MRKTFWENPDQLKAVWQLLFLGEEMYIMLKGRHASMVLVTAR